MDKWHFLFTGIDWLLAPIVIWTMFWKSYAIWTAAKRDEKKWFIVLLLVNTIGILEIVYLFKFAGKTRADVRRLLHTKISSLWK